MLVSFATQTVTRLRPSFTDDGHGNMMPDWDTPDTLDIPGCSVQPGLSQEDRVNRDASLVAYTVWAPPTADVHALDRVQFAGTVFEVDGEPQRWMVGFLNHTKLFLKRWDG